MIKKKRLIRAKTLVRKDSTDEDPVFAVITVTDNGKFNIANVISEYPDLLSNTITMDDILDNTHYHSRTKIQDYELKSLRIYVD